MSGPVAPSAFDKDHPFPARVSENRLLSRPGSGKETRHFVVRLEGSGLSYKAGDSLGIFPTNRAEDVAAILAHLGATGAEPVLLPKATEPITLAEALTSRLALAGPTRKIVDTLATRATDAAEKARLAALLVPEAKEALEAFLAEREYADLLAEFPSARLSPQAP